MPWEIRPGNLIRVRGVLPNADSLNASTRDGVAVFRIAATEYRQSENAATLELTATPSPSPAPSPRCATSSDDGHGVEPMARDRPPT
jgi:hypothetical protein